MPQSPTDAELFEAWQQARGKWAPVISAEERRIILAALRDDWNRKKNLPALKHCETCGCKARGEHQRRSTE